jgi:DNA-binding sugar fermentation-stimulating protein
MTDNNRLHCVFEVPQLIEAIVKHRPSKVVKSPYLADIIIDGQEYLCHSPSLGCCNLIVANSKCFVTPKITANKNVKSKYSLDVVLDKQTRVGVNPTYANYIIFNAINLNLIKDIPILTELKKEVKKGDSRLDMIGKTDSKNYYIEVKSVPIASHKNCTDKEYKKLDLSKYNNNELIAVFPVGSKKILCKDAISPRAIKHIEELEKIKINEENAECYLIFVIQRSDCKYFQTSDLDPIYKSAVKKASDNGVIIKAYQVVWIDNKVFWDKELIVLL